MTVLYSKMRNEIKTGDLIAYDTEEIDSFFGFVLYLYQKILKAKYTHVGIAVCMGGRVFIVEATPPEVRLVPLAMCGNFYHIKTDMPATEQSMMTVLFSHLGKKYSLFDLVKSKIGFANNTSDLYCSELAGDFYNTFGYITDRKVGTTPDSIVEAVLGRSGSTPVKVVIDKGNLP